MRRAIPTRALVRALPLMCLPLLASRASFAVESRPPLPPENAAVDPLAPEATPPAAAALDLPLAGGLGSARVVPPRVAPEGRARVVVLLHGMCDEAAWMCDRVPREALGDRFVVCPRAPRACRGGGALWSGGTERTREIVLASLEALDARFGDGVETRRQVVLAGFSQGAYVAAAVATSAPGPFSELLLVGSRVSPAAVLLRANGVERVLLAAGEFDGARPDMTLAARVLDRAGMPARFVSLGRAGHSFAPSEAWLREALGWLARRGD